MANSTKVNLGVFKAQDIRDILKSKAHCLQAGFSVNHSIIVTFEEILELCKGRVGIYLDLKDASVERLVSIVKKWGMTGQVLWYADLDELERVAELCPECILMPDPGPEENLPQVIERFKPSVIAAVWRHYSRSFAATCHQAGAIVIVDESGPACWADALAWGSDGIQSDHPGQLIAFLKLRKR